MSQLSGEIYNLAIQVFRLVTIFTFCRLSGALSPAKGRDLEKVVLSRAVRWHIDNRVLLSGNKTVVFD
jgi:hypothetical protein